MSHKIIPYPCDYKTTTSVRRSRKAGNVFVLILCVIILLLIGAAVYFGMTNDYQALKNMQRINIRPYCGEMPPERPQEPVMQDPQSKASEMPAEETTVPGETKAPDTKPPVAPEPTKAPNPVAETPMPTPVASTDPEYEQKLAEPFDAETFEGLPDIVEAVSSSVVGILNYQYSKTTQKLQIAGTGSGFVLTTDGYIVTNQHVVDGAALVRVSFADGTVEDAAIVGSDVQSDVAVLKIENNSMAALPLGNSDTIRVGEFVLAIGNPISSDSLYGSVTFGIISAKERLINIDGFENEYIQTDAAVNPGNSGGPLINMNGEVIGVTSAKYVTAGYDELGNSISSEGIGFALPIRNVMQIVDVLIKNGGVPRPGIGITIATRSEEEAQIENKPAGVYIYSLTEGGPAQLAGLQVDDIIIALDGTEMTQDEFVEVIRSKTIGDQITFTVLRSGEQLEIAVTIGDLNHIKNGNE